MVESNSVGSCETGEKSMDGAYAEYGHQEL